VALCKHYQALSIINDDLTLCLSSGADGVHLGKRDGNVQEAREALGPRKILGVTCHADLDYALTMQTHGADYCAFGRLFNSTTKPEAPPCPLEILQKAQQHDLKTVAIGGINTTNIDILLPYRPSMIAVIAGVFGQADIQHAARALANHF